MFGEKKGITAYILISHGPLFKIPISEEAIPDFPKGAFPAKAIRIGAVSANNFFFFLASALLQQFAGSRHPFSCCLVAHDYIPTLTNSTKLCMSFVIEAIDLKYMLNVVVIEIQDAVRAGSCEILRSFTYRILRKHKKFVLQCRKTEKRYNRKLRSRHSSCCLAFMQLFTNVFFFVFLFSFFSLFFLRASFRCCVSIRLN